MEPTSSQPTLDPADFLAGRRYVRRRHDVIQLCMIAVLVVALNAGINVMTSPGRPWFLWIAQGFAIALGFGALEAFGRELRLGRPWRHRNMREFLARQGH